MEITKKVLSLLLVLVMVVGLLPVSAFATEEYVYLSISFDGEYINDQTGKPIMYVPISMDDIAAVDLTKYNLDNMQYDSDGDGNNETTALQLIIYAHENLYGGSWSNVVFEGTPGSSYFRGGVFGFTENLVYFLNGDFPVDDSQQSDSMTYGATSERIILEAGDFLDIASFSCYSFVWDTAGGFHLFADQNDEYVHDYTATAGTPLTVNLKHSFCDLTYGQSWVENAAEYEIHYGSTYGTIDDTVTTDESGSASITFAEAGTYYLWCSGDTGTDDGYTHSACNYYLENGVPCIVSAPAYAKVTVTGNTTGGGSGEGGSGTGGNQGSEQTRQPQDVSAVLNATMTKMAETVTAPTFGTNAGEWTVFSLARGNHFAKDNAYFTDYYDRIVQTVNTTAASVDKGGALDNNKSTENSRLIVALSAIGKDATSVGNWDLVNAYSENGINWIKRQGLNGTIWALIALDSNDYATTDATIRQACVDSILTVQHEDGGWNLVNTDLTLPSNADITGMTLTALYPYRNQPDVAAACEEAIAWLSESQLATGGFPYGTGETSESCAWAIIALTTWGINPDTDPRFIKNGNSAVDNLLSYYIEEDAMFAHQGTVTNGMGTDQACYALVAYDRFINSKNALFDFSDVTFDAPGTGNEGGSEEGGADESDPSQMNATLSLPAEVENAVGTEFNAIISIDKWNNEAGYKLVDFLMTIPEGLSVTGVTAGERLAGGSVSYNLDTEGNLRCVYFDANENKSLTITGEEFPAEVFTVSFKIEEIIADESLKIAIGGMSVKLNSDSSEDADSMIIVNTDPVTNPDGGITGGGSGDVGIVTGISFSAVELYKGDDVDLIPATKKAVAVAVTGIDRFSTLVYNDGTNNIQFLYSDQITSKTNIPTFVALVDSEIAMTNFINKDYFTVNGTGVDPSNISFGNANGDDKINAQDALAVVDAWLRKGDAPTDDLILRMNVNGDSRINTFDALGIVEAFVNGSTYGVVTKAATMAPEQ